MFILLGVLSGLLLAFAIPPYSVAFFSLFIFAPLVFLGAQQSPLPRRELFASGFIAGAIGAASLSYAVFHAFAWPTDAPAILTLIHWSPILWALLGGCTGGFGLLIYRSLRSGSPIKNAALFAGMYILFEQLLQFITGHYYVGALAYTATSTPISFGIASLGGELFVSFTIAFVGALLGEGAYKFLIPAACARTLRHIAILFVIAVCAYAGNAYYLYGTPAATRDLRVATIQTGSRDAITFATTTANGLLAFPQFADELVGASSGGSDLIVYPLAVSNSALYAGTAPAQNYDKLPFTNRSAFAAWMGAHAPASTTVVSWDINYQGGDYFQNYDFWQNGALIDSYSKREPYAFTEYTPTFAHFGFGPYPVPVAPGNGSGLTTVDGFTIADLQCSEVHLASLARAGAASAQLFLAIGLEWIFPGPMGEVYSLKAAQYRAAENNIFAIRATAEGPSAFISSSGWPVQTMNFNAIGSMQATLAIPLTHRATLYSLFGNYPLYAGILALFVCALLQKKRSGRIKFPGTRG